MTIGIIGAFDEEIENLIKVFNLNKDENSNRNIFVGISDNKKLVVANSGIGKVNSGAMTQYLIDKYQPDMIINSGCAGSLITNNNIMDIIISSYVTYHDFTPIRVMAYSVPDEGKIKADEKLIKITKEALNDLKINNYKVAAIASGDCFVTDDKIRDSIYDCTKAVAVDMESASIGHISKINNVPFVAIRTISDFADGNDDFEKEAAYNSSMIVKKMIELL